jgi:peptidoglycan/LPS O-acetylase OafA/YrhL
MLEKTSQRIESLDLFRLVAAFGVIAIHAKSGNDVSKFYGILFWPICVPFFYVTSIYFFYSGLQRNSVRQTFDKMCSRILVPYFCWTAIYSSLLFIKSYLTGSQKTYEIWKMIFYGESAVHLYFLPILVFIQTLLASLYFVLKNPALKFRILGLFLFALCTAYFSIGYINQCFGISALGQLIAIATYFIVVVAITNSSILPKAAFSFQCLGAVMTAGAIILNLQKTPLKLYGYPMILPLGGLGLMLLSLGSYGISLPRWLKNITKLSFGIYLCHVLFLESIEFIFEKMGMTNSNVLVTTLIVIVVFFLSIVFVHCLRKFQILSRYLLGE